MNVESNIKESEYSPYKKSEREALNNKSFLFVKDNDYNTKELYLNNTILDNIKNELDYENLNTVNNNSYIKSKIVNKFISNDKNILHKLKIVIVDMALCVLNCLFLIIHLFVIQSSYNKNIKDINYNSNNKNIIFSNNIIKFENETFYFVKINNKILSITLINNFCFLFLFISISIAFIIYCIFNNILCKDSSYINNNNIKIEFRMNLIILIFTIVSELYCVINTILLIINNNQVLISYNIFNVSLILNIPLLFCDYNSKIMTIIIFMINMIIYISCQFINKIYSRSNDFLFINIVLNNITITLIFYIIKNYIESLNCKTIKNKKKVKNFSKLKNSKTIRNFKEQYKLSKNMLLETLNFEEVLQSMSFKFICFDNITPVYYNKSYKELIDKITNNYFKIKYNKISNIDKYCSDKNVKELNNNNNNNEYKRSSNIISNYNDNNNLINKNKLSQNNIIPENKIMYTDPKNNNNNNTSNINIINNNYFYNYKRKLLTFEEKSSEFISNLYKFNNHDINNNNNSHKISLLEMIEDLNIYNLNEEISNEFIKLGVYIYNQNSILLDNYTINNDFFEVYYRKVLYNNSNKHMLQFIMYEVTEVKEGEKVRAESKYKQKILSKIAHEFKTPLNNIISLAQTISDYNSEILEMNETNKININNLIYCYKDSLKIIEKGKINYNNSLTFNYNNCNNKNFESNMTIINNVIKLKSTAKLDSFTNIIRSNSSNKLLSKLAIASNNLKSNKKLLKLENNASNNKINNTSSFSSNKMLLRVKSTKKYYNNNNIILTNKLYSSKFSVNNSISFYKKPNDIIIKLNKLYESIKESVINSNKVITIINSLANFNIFQVNDLINYSENFENKTFKLSNDEINIKELLTFCYEILEALIFCSGNKNNTIKPVLYIDEEIEDLVFTSDELRVKQILLNLITNSVKFTKFGKITISAISEVNRKTSDKYIVIKVSDTGPGIKDNEIISINRKLNEKYSSQIDDDNYMSSKGTGLGLFICKANCNILNFDFLIEPNNKGTTIAIKLLDAFNTFNNNPYNTFNNKFENDANIKNVPSKEINFFDYLINNMINQDKLQSNIFKRNKSVNIYDINNHNNNISNNMSINNNNNRIIENLANIIFNYGNPLTVSSSNIAITENKEKSKVRFAEEVNTNHKRSSIKEITEEYNLETNSLRCLNNNSINKNNAKDNKVLNYNINTAISSNMSVTKTLYSKDTKSITKIMSNNSNFNLKRIKTHSKENFLKTSLKKSDKDSSKKLNNQLILLKKATKKESSNKRHLTKRNIRCLSSKNLVLKHSKYHVINNKKILTKSNYVNLKTNSKTEALKKQSKLPKNISEHTYEKDNSNNKINYIIKKTSNSSYESHKSIKDYNITHKYYKNQSLMSNNKITSNINNLNNFEDMRLNTLLSMNEESGYDSNGLSSNYKTCKKFNNKMKYSNSTLNDSLLKNINYNKSNNENKLNNSFESNILDNTILNRDINIDLFLKLRKEVFFCKSYKIIVVDDNQQIMKAISKLLKKVIIKNNYKFDIIQGRDGLDTLKYIMDDKEGLIRIVFTDEHMEFMNGSESANLVRKYIYDRKISNNIFFVSVTCFSDEETKSNIQSAGIDYVISKPTTEQKLFEIMKKIVIQIK